MIGPLGISVLDFKKGQWRDLKQIEGLPPRSVTTLARARDSIWIGGKGFIAHIDPRQEKLLGLAYVNAPKVDRIQTGGGYIWAQFDWHLYRAPLVSMP